jgi:tetratricopeptide (TPR) repeat protein
MTAIAANTPPSSETTPETAAAAVATMGTANENLLAALATKDCLAEVLARQGKHGEAEAMLRDTLETRVKVLCQTREHPDVRRTMNNLAGTLIPDKIVEAEILFRQVFEADEQALGCEHVYTITSMNNLAEILSRQGKHKEAVDLQRRTVKLSQIVRGFDHPETVALMDNLRELLTRQGEIAEAEQMLRERPILHQKVMERQKEYREEEVLHRKALAQCQTDVERITALKNLAELLETEGRYTEAEDFFQQLVKLFIDVYGSGNQGLQSSQRGLGVVMSKQRKYKEAEEVFRGLLLVQKTDVD